MKRVAAFPIFLLVASMLVLAQQPAAAPPQAGDGDTPVQMNFDNAGDIYPVINRILGELGINYIIDPGIRGTINLNMSVPIKKSELLPLLETILKINNATMVKLPNGFYEIVPAPSASRQPLSVQDRAPATSPDDQMVLQVIRMRFASAADMASLLQPYTSEGAAIVTQGSNIMLITERRSNLRKLIEIIDIFDTNVFENERVSLLPVRNNLVRDIVGDLGSIVNGYGLSGTSAIRLIPLERINSILVVTPNPTVLPEVQKWLERLDQKPERIGLQNFVYKVKNAKADEIQGILSQLYGGQLQLSSIYNLPSSQAATTPGGVPGAAPGALPGATPQPGTSAPPSGAATALALNPKAGDIRIISVPASNMLLIQASSQVYEEIRRTIEELDILPRQVLIDAQIIQVGLDNSLSLGISAALQARSLASKVTTASFGTNTGPPALVGQTTTMVGNTREIVAFLNASENRSRIRTLSAPSVMVSDNKSADFQVGAEVPVPTSSSVTPVQNGGSNLFVQTIQLRPTGVLLSVTPQINDSGNVTLQISQEVSEAAVNTTSAVVAPVISKTSVKSTIVVQDGQTIVLSGFIRDNDESTNNRLPLLGRIPVAGALFGNTRKVKGRNELIVLITPHVIRTFEDADRATDEMKVKLKEIQKVLK